MINEMPNPREHALLELEAPICDLGRLARAIAVIGESVRRDIEGLKKVNPDWERGFNNHLNADLEVLFDYADRASDQALELRNAFYAAAMAHRVEDEAATTVYRH